MTGLAWCEGNWSHCHCKWNTNTQRTLGLGWSRASFSPGISFLNLVTAAEELWIIFQTSSLAFSSTGRSRGPKCDGEKWPNKCNSVSAASEFQFPANSMALKNWVSKVGLPGCSFVTLQWRILVPTPSERVSWNDHGNRIFYYILGHVSLFLSKISLLFFCERELNFFLWTAPPTFPLSASLVPSSWNCLWISI